MREELVTARKAKGYTQEDMAGFLGIQRAAYAHYETGYSTPTLENAHKIKMLLDVGDEVFLDISHDFFLHKNVKKTI